MPTLLQINVTANWGSTGKIAEQIGDCAISQGWRSYIAYGRMSNPSKSHLIKIGSSIDVLEHFVENKFLDNEGLASRCATRRLLQKIRQISPDIVHLHNIHDHYLNYPILFDFLAKQKIPVVWTQHDQWATTGHCCFNLKGCEKWQSGCCDCPENKWFSLDKSSRNYELKKKLFESLDYLHIVAVSKWLEGKLKRSFLKDRPITVIHNGIDLNTFCPQTSDVYEQYGIEKHRKIVLGVSAVWDERKGLNDFFELAKKLDEKDFSIIIVGRLKRNVVKQVDGCPIHYVDRTQNQIELAQLYSAASVFVNPTYQDNYPTTNLEAMACGTPVVTYRTGGSGEAVSDETGCVVERGNIDKLATAVLSFLQRDTKHLCRQRAIALFDKNKCFNSYIHLYQRLIGGGKIILGVSSVWPRSKGLEDFVELSKDDTLTVVLVGLKHYQVKELKKKDCNIIAIERTQNPKELAMLYSMADVYVSLSYFETFGLTILEAMACGTPAVVYDNTNQKEMISPETGIAVKSGDVEAARKAIYMMIENDFKKKHSDDCRKRAELFDKNACYWHYVDLYEKLLIR